MILKLLGVGEKRGFLGSLTDIFTNLNSKLNPKTNITADTIKSAKDSFLANQLEEKSYKRKRVAIKQATIAKVEHTAATEAGTAGAVGQAGANATLSASFKALWASMKPVLLALATNPLTWLIAIGAAAVALQDFYTVDYKEAHEALEESKEKYEESAEAVESLSSELETVKERIEELQDLKDSGDITLEEEAELEQLISQNEELERQIALEKELLKIKSKDLIDDAKEAMDKGSHSVAQSVATGDETGKSNAKGIVGEVADHEAIAEDIDAINTYEDKISEFEQKVVDAQTRISNAKTKKEENIAKIDLKSAEDELQFYKDAVVTLYEDLETRADSVRDNLKGLKLDPETYAEDIKILEDALDSIANMNLTETEQKLKAIESYFSDKENEDIKELQDEIVEYVKIRNDLIVDENEDLVENLENEKQKISDWGLDEYKDDILNETIQSKFGNVDMDKRSIITWSNELKETYRKELDSWDYNPEVGSIDTVFGGSDRFENNSLEHGVEVAFTPIMNGEILDKNSVYEYINSLIDEATVNGVFSEERLLDLDAQGKQIGDTFISGIIAAADEGLNYENNGNWAEVVGRLMHFAGDYGAISLGYEKIEKATNETESSAKDLEEIFNEMGVDFEETGLDAEALVKYFEDMVDPSSETAENAKEISSALNNINDLADMSTKLDSLSSAYEEFKDGGFVTAKTLSGIDEKIQELDGYDLFASVVGNPNSTAKEVQEAFDSIVTEFVLSQKSISDIVNLTEDEVAIFVANLKSMGITNAEEIVDKIRNSYSEITNLIDNAREEYYNYCLDKSSYNEDFINSTISSNGQLVQALGSAYKDDYDNWCNLLRAKAEAYNELMTRIESASNRFKTIMTSGPQTLLDAQPLEWETQGLLDAAADYSQASKDLEEFEKTFAYDYDPISTDFGGGFSYSGGGSGSGSGGGGSENQPEVFNWIERAIKKVQRAIERLGKTSGATYKTWTKRNKALANQITKVRDEITTQEKAYDYYMDKANSVGLSKEYKDLVKSGKIKIETIKDDKLKEKIQSYQDWYDKALECKDVIQDLAAEEAALYMQAFDNVTSKYDAIFERYDYRQSMFDEFVSQAEAQGHMVSAEYYNSMIKYEKLEQKYLRKERDELLAALEAGVDAEGNPIEKGSEDWNTMVNRINEVTVAIEESDTAIMEWQNDIRDLEWGVFDKLQEQISKINDEAEFLIELMSNDDMYDDDGNLTEEGMATIGLHGQNYNVYMEQASQYAEEIKKIEEDIAKDPYNQDLIERKQELIELQRESILAAEDEKQSIKDLVEEGINKELEALQELIDKKKEALQSEKDLYEYQKKMKDLTKEQASIQKQLAAYQGDDSEENKAKLQQLKVQLEESQEAIEESEYEKYMSDQQELLDKLYEEYEETLNSRLDDIDALIEETILEININARNIQQTLEEQAAEVGVTLSDELQSIWGTDSESMNSVLTTYGDGMTKELTNVNYTLEVMNENLLNMITQLNEIAGTEIEGAISENAYYSDEANPPENNGGNNGGGDGGNDGNNGGNDGNNNGGGSGDGKITKGEKVTFKEGKYTERADGTGTSGSYKLGKKVYVTSIKSKAKRPYHISQDKAGNKPLGWVKKSQLKGYYTGAKHIDEDQWAITQEKGLEAIMHNGSLLTPLAKGSTVFNADATENLYDFMNDPYKFISDNIALQQLSSIPRLNDFGNYEYNGDMSFELILPNVTNYEQFKYALKHDPDFEQSIRAMTIDRMMGKSALRKYK